MHGVAAAVGAWLDAGEDPVVVRVPLAEGIGGAGPGEVLAFGPPGHRVGGLLGGAVDDVAARLMDEVRATGQRQVESVQITGDLAVALVVQAGFLGSTTEVVADASAAVAASEQLGVSDAVVVLSHDPAVDLPVLIAALAAGVGYVGALGSRRTQEKRMDRLIAAGATAEDLDALRGPADLDLGGTTASEVALSICAEVLAIRNGQPPASLHATSGPIHR
jgi:xanthine/CO dehydrogenase XdhC/CoxF family maturation factor